MKGFDTQLYVWLLVVSNIIAILQLIASIKYPRIARLSFFLLFAWAAMVNWTSSQDTPKVYLDYAALTWSGWYRGFIEGWFALHIRDVVGFIAICQALIAFSMLLKGWVFRIGAIGAIIFLLALLPLGVGAGFPCTAVMAAAIYVLLIKRHDTVIWKREATIAAKKQ